MSKKLALLALLALAPSAHAGVYGDTLGKCLVSSSSDQDKQQLMEWIFAAISLNPAISPYANISPDKREEIDKNMAGLFERLIGATCKKESSEALKYEGPGSFGAAFQLLGQVAGQQIFASPEVAKGAENFYKQLDIETLQKELGLESTERSKP